MKDHCNVLGILLDPLFRSYLPATGVIWIWGVKRPQLGAPQNPAVGCLILNLNKRKFSSIVSTSVDRFGVGSIIPDDRAIRGVIRAKKRWKYPPAIYEFKMPTECVDVHCRYGAFPICHVTLPSGTPLQIYGGAPKVVLYNRKLLLSEPPFSVYIYQ